MKSFARVSISLCVLFIVADVTIATIVAADSGIVGCSFLPREPVDDAERTATDYSVGLLFREYDLNGDGLVDFMTARHVEMTLAEESHAVDPRPMFYWVDVDGDDRYDQVWVDRGGQGRCDDIVLYEGTTPEG